MSEPIDNDRELLHVVFAGHVDHGKSTLLGRLYADTDALPAGHLDRVRDICAKQGKLFEYAFLFDAFLEEQEQGITIDTARTFFTWEKRQYQIIDAPGHREFLKNMISGAARAEAAVLVVDACEGVREQSRLHGYLLSLLGIRQVAVVVNKMDLVDFQEPVFAAIVEEYGNFLVKLNLSPLFIPASARAGDNVVRRSAGMPWHRGPTLLESLGLFVKGPDLSRSPLRLPVQDVYKFDGRRILAGRVEAGTLRVGEQVVFSPSNKSAVVKSIEGFNLREVPGLVPAGRSAGFTLDQQLFIERGEIVSLKDSPPDVCVRFRATLFWMGKEPLRRERKYLLRIATSEVAMELEGVIGVIDAEMLLCSGSADRVERDGLAEVVIRTRKPVALDSFSDIQATGRFVVVDGYDIRGGGVVLEPLRDEQEPLRRLARQRDLKWRRGEVLQAERALRNGHNPGMILFTGEKGSGKGRLARHLERRLFDGGRQVYLLDGKNLFLELEEGAQGCSREQMLRRFCEVAQVLLRSGLIVVAVTNSFALEEHEMIRTLVYPQRVVTVHIFMNNAAPMDHADLSLPASEDVRAAGRKIIEAMEEEGILL